jgi:glycosyltransferase involved in cell wall biosynthesis
MKLIYAAGSRVPSNTANSVHVMRMCEALAGLGHEVVLVAKQGSDPVADVFRHYGVKESFRLERVPFRNRSGLVGYLRRFDQLLAADVDLVIGRYLYPLLLAQMRGKHTIYESHEPAIGRKRALERWYFARPGVQRHVLITRVLERHYSSLAAYGSVERRVIADAAVDPGAPAAIGTGANLSIGFAGGWYRGRGIELIVGLAERLPQHQFRLAGGDEGDLRRLGLSITDNITCAGYLPHGEVAEFLAPCDVLIAPYQAQVATHGDRGDIAGFFSPMKLFEYMALGKAIVCTDLDVLHEVLDDTMGMFVPVGDMPVRDIDAWRRAINTLDVDRERLQRLGHAARARFLQRHTWQRRAEMLLEGLADENRSGDP